MFWGRAAGPARRAGPQATEDYTQALNLKGLVHLDSVIIGNWWQLLFPFLSTALDRNVYIILCLLQHCLLEADNMFPESHRLIHGEDIWPRVDHIQSFTFTWFRWRGVGLWNWWYLDGTVGLSEDGWILCMWKTWLSGDPGADWGQLMMPQRCVCPNHQNLWIC